jgi:serine/threonine-protein kinase
MFVEEARIGACLQSPNVAEVHDFVHDRGNYYMVLEWIEGIDLGSWVKWHMGRKEHTRWELVAAVGVGILRGLAAAHERVGPDGRAAPVVHRDVSPHNVLLTTRGMVKLIDFGLALAQDRTQETTDPGIVKGKMSYLAPEIVAGGRPTPTSDQFACGSVLYEALVGRKLFDGANDYETYTRLRDCLVPPLRGARPDVPQQFTTIIHRALMPAHDARFPSTREMARQIGQTLKKVQLRKDLHTVLARTVADARQQLGISVGEASTLTPIVELTPPPRITPPRPQESVPAPMERRGLGLLHRLPNLFGFGRKRG